MAYVSNITPIYSIPNFTKLFSNLIFPIIFDNIDNWELTSTISG